MSVLQKYVTVILIAIYFGIPEVVISNAEILNAAINSSTVLRADNSTHNKSKDHFLHLPRIHPLNLFHSKENKSHSSHGVTVELKTLNLTNATSAAPPSLKISQNQTSNATRVTRAVGDVKGLNVSSNLTLSAKSPNSTFNSTGSQKPRAILLPSAKNSTSSNTTLSLKGAHNLTSNGTSLKSSAPANLTDKVMSKNSTQPKNTTVLPRSTDAFGSKHNASVKSESSNVTSSSRNFFSLFQNRLNTTNSTSSKATAGRLATNSTLGPKREVPSFAGGNSTRTNSTKKVSNVTESLHGVNSSGRGFAVHKLNVTGHVVGSGGNSSSRPSTVGSLNRTRRQLSEDAERVLPPFFSRPTASPAINAPPSGSYGYNLPAPAYSQQSYTATVPPTVAYGQPSSYPTSYPSMSPSAAVYGQQLYASSTTTAAPAYAQPAYYAVPMASASTQAPLVPAAGIASAPASYSAYPLPNAYNTPQPYAPPRPTPAPYSPPAYSQPSQGAYGARQ